MSENTPTKTRPDVATKFTFPQKLALATGYKSVIIRELTRAMEQRALARGGNDGAALIQELVAESIVRAEKLDGTVQEISIGDASIDLFMGAIGPMGRTAVATAYGKVNQPDKSDVEDFLKTAETTAG